MDDADLGKPISETCQAVDSRSNGKDNGAGDNAATQAENGPTRYWIISAAFPMIAGTLGPVASAFSICALVEKWRVVIPPGSLITDAYPIPDPYWLYVINAVQLVIALIANLFLLLNMAKRVRFSIAQPITIAGWYLSAICLIALVATASGPLQDVETDGDMVWSQAFYYGLFASVLYFLVASLMSVTIWGANSGRYSKEFKLTPSQRTLMLQTIMFLLYLLLGALLFSKIEDWDYLDGVYWADVTLFTVGYGDFSPSTTLGRALLMPYALIGITSLGLVIGSIRSMVLDRGKTQLDARALEKKRRQSIRRLLRKEQQGILEPIDGEALIAFPELKGKRLPRSEFERRGAEFTMMRRIQAQASVRRRWTAMAVSTSTWLVLWLLGAKIFELCEADWQGWSYFDAFYFCYTGLTTIGYGDITPISNAGRAFFVIWSLLALPTMTVLISNAGDTIVKLVRDGTLKLGNLTILPGEMAFSREAKMFLHKITLGLVSAPEEDVEASPPGFFGFISKHRQHESDADDNYDGNDAAEDLVRARRDRLQEAMDELDRQENELIPRGHSPKSDRPEGSPSAAGPAQRTRSEYHLLLIDEICKVTQHLQEQPARVYSYAEWAWYLRLMGEDEASAETHRAPHPPKKKTSLLTKLNTRRASVASPKSRRPSDNNTVADANEDGQQEQQPRAASKILGDEDEEGPASPSDTVRPTTSNQQQQQQDEEKTKWSWVGTQSPLLDPREEAQWILDRLQEKLRSELRDAAIAQKQERVGRGDEPLSRAGTRFTELRKGEDPIAERTK